ncbi:cytochrome P450 [Podospora fimiseda]|uniref:Cytochrome P450 n=1 Tax=Podospora fimiseda TaxID=252190 RepID=A0AAN7H5Y1_9PEZI|nr:cytochrome P450 [Podospora fimiseda]
MWPQIILVLISCIILYSFKSHHRLRHIPGPFLATISPLWMIHKLSTGRFVQHLKQTSDNYGPLVRIGPNDLLCTDPDTIRRMSSVRSMYTKGRFYESGRVIPGFDNVVSERNEGRHRELRTKMTGAFAARQNGSLAGFEASLDDQLLKLVGLINDKYVSERNHLRPFDLTAKSHFLTLDMISSTSFGKAFGFLEEDKDLYSFLEITDSATPVMNLLAVVPMLTNLVYRWPMRLLLPNTGDRAGLGRLMGLAQGCVDERLSPGAKEGKDMLQAFIKAGMGYDDLIQQMFVQIVAGSITTASAIRHTLLALISTPSAYTALQKEIDDNITSGRISSPIITDSEAEALPYLQAVIKEGMRMWPPTTGFGSKQVPKGGDVICGFQVPEGTQIAQNFVGIMRLKDVWGEDADAFRPERWLEVEEEGKKVFESVIDLCFGGGKYQCLGKRLALMELNKVFVELLRRYDFALIDPQNRVESKSGVFWVSSEVLLRVTRRQ